MIQRELLAMEDAGEAAATVRKGENERPKRQILA
jgi:hypothetical protein